MNIRVHVASGVLHQNSRLELGDKSWSSYLWKKEQQSRGALDLL